MLVYLETLEDGIITNPISENIHITDNNKKNKFSAVKKLSIVTLFFIGSYSYLSYKYSKYLVCTDKILAQKTLYEKYNSDDIAVINDVTTKINNLYNNGISKEFLEKYFIKSYIKQIEKHKYLDKHNIKDLIMLINNHIANLN